MTGATDKRPTELANSAKQRRWHTRTHGAPQGQNVADSYLSPGVQIALLTGCADQPYALGLASALISEGIFLDFIGSDQVDGPVLHDTSQVNFLNLRRDQSLEAGFVRKASRVLAYYLRLVRYAATSERKIFHILWNNKFEFIDRTVLMLYYRLLGKRIAFTAHNVNADARDSNDSLINRFSLRIQYRLSGHLFVHTNKMKSELVTEFGVPDHKVTVIPFGINNTVPNTDLTTVEAKRILGVRESDKTILFFGNIAPYKGLEYLISAFGEVAKNSAAYRLIIAGRPKGCEHYWNEIQDRIRQNCACERVIERIEYIPDEKVELYFKGADVLVLPYTHIYQSGVLFLGYSFGLPVIAADVGSLKEDIIEGKTGFAFKSRDSIDLAKTIHEYFSSNLFRNLPNLRKEIRNFANERNSWSKVGELTKKAYSQLMEQ